MGKSVDFEPSGDGDWREPSASVTSRYFQSRLGSLWFPREEYIGSKIHGYLVESNGFCVPGAFRLSRDMTWVLIECFTSISRTELTFLVNDDTKACIRLNDGELSKWVFKFNECKDNERKHT